MIKVFLDGFVSAIILAEPGSKLTWGLLWGLGFELLMIETPFLE